MTSFLNWFAFYKKVKKNLIKHQKSYLNNKIVGVNIGKNKNSSEAIDDYLIGLEELGDLASYITITYPHQIQKGWEIYNWGEK